MIKTHIIACGVVETISSHHPSYVCGYIKDDGQMLEATNKVLTSVCSDIIRAVVQIRIYRGLMLDLREKAMSSCSFINEKLPNAVEKEYNYCIHRHPNFRI